MTDGFFDSDSSGSSYDSDDYFFYGGSGGGGSLLGLLILLGVILLVGAVIRSCNESKLNAERELDRTVYQKQAEENFASYVNKRPYQWRESIIQNTVWIEPGSSRLDNSYHCKGIQFDTRDGRQHTLCCNVKKTEPDCIRLENN